MAKLRGRNARYASTPVGRGSSGYSTGEKYVMPRMTPLQCPGCSKSIAYEKQTNTFVCGRCGGRFTPGQIKASSERMATLADQRRREQYEQERAEKEARWAEEDRVRRALIADGNTSVVYYIRFRDAVKIGTSIDVEQRLTNHPWEELVAIEPGGIRLERQRHKMLRSSRLDGEWFELTGDVVDVISDVNRVNAQWYAKVFACAGPLPVAKGGAVFPRLSDYPSMT